MATGKLENKNMKIGILGGTFNPIHVGHLVLADQVQEALNLDKIIFVPTYLPPHKEALDLIDAQFRLKMVKLAIEDNKKFSVSDIEIKRKGISYTIQTLKDLRKIYKDDDLFFIVGSDASIYLNGWKDIGDSLKLAKFVMATRPGYSLKNINPKILTVEIKALEISGVQIRRRIKEHKSIRYLVPEIVRNYILKKGLYA